MSTFEERKAKGEQIGIADAVAALGAMRDIVDGLGGRKLLAVAFGVVYVDPGKAQPEIDIREISGTAYDTEVATAIGGFTEALVELQDDLTSHIVEKAKADGYSFAEGGAS